MDTYLSTYDVPALCEGNFFSRNNSAKLDSSHFSQMKLAMLRQGT